MIIFEMLFTPFEAIIILEAAEAVLKTILSLKLYHYEQVQVKLINPNPLNALYLWNISL